MSGCCGCWSEDKSEVEELTRTPALLDDSAADEFVEDDDDGDGDKDNSSLFATSLTAFSSCFCTLSTSNAAPLDVQSPFVELRITAEGGVDSDDETVDSLSDSFSDVVLLSPGFDISLKF